MTTAFNAGMSIYYNDGFGVFEVKRYADPFFATMTKYDENYTNPVLFGPRPQYDTFGEILAREGLHQLRLAETEKYAHVTYFFNGGREEQFDGEDRELIPSDRSVPTYDLAPAMRAREITEAAVKAIESGRYDAIVMNYANADMVGHTGKWEPTIEAVRVIDECLERLAQCTLRSGGLLVVTADHGNAEEELDDNDEPVTAHTTNPVPLVLVAADLRGTLTRRGQVRRRRADAAHDHGLTDPRADDRTQPLHAAVDFLPEKFREVTACLGHFTRLWCHYGGGARGDKNPMHRHFYDVRDVVVFAQALIGFVFAGTAAVALAVAAHALQ